MKPAQETDGLALLLRSLKLPSFTAFYESTATKAEAEAWSFPRYLYELAQQEVNDRSVRKVERMRAGSHLPPEKTLATLDVSRLPVKVRRLLPTLCEGKFLEAGENVLAFGLPGRGKTHCLCAIGHELVARGHAVLFVPAYRLVQELLAAKRDLALEREIRRLDRFAAVIVDDIGYVQHDREEMEVLFTFLSERHERRSVMITSNLVFSQWDRIFKDPMTTACAIDRIVHHATILEMTGESYRTEAAKQRNRATKIDAPSMQT
jgi:DNA replication protein DnaC